MNYNHQRIKENARVHYRENMGPAIGVALIATIAEGFGTVVNRSGRHSPALEHFSLNIVVLILSIFVLSVIVLGAAGWFTRSIRQPKLPVTEMFSGFRHNYVSNVVTMLLKAIFIFLWSLLLVVPGIVKMYAYRMTEYIKCENPDIAPRRAIEMSMTMTNGAKGQLFYLDLSFFGWFLLSTMTLGILGIIYVFPYYNAAVAFAYEELKADALNEGKLSAAEFVPGAR